MSIKLTLRDEPRDFGEGFNYAELGSPGNAVWDGDGLFIKTDGGWVDGGFTEYGLGETWSGRRVRVTEIIFEEV